MKKWVFTIGAAVVFVVAALTAHYWVPPVVDWIGKNILGDEKVSRLNDAAELLSKIVMWPAAAVSFFVGLWRRKKDDEAHGDNVSGDKVVGDKVDGNKYEASAGGTIIVTEQAAAAAEPRLPSPLFQLPQPPADFTGREAELRELLEVIEHGGVHISGLQGQGGVGKTALALKLAAELAPRFTDAQIFLDLKGASEKPLTAAEALAHVVRSFHPEAKRETEDEWRALFTSVLRDKHALLLMDNARDARQVQPLIPPAGSTLLVTSRWTFTLPGLHPKRLDTLPPKDANELLIKIAPRIGSAADAIAKSCGYLALALRLAATAIAEHADLDPADYAKRLADESKRLSLLPGAGGDQSMEASIALSYNLLDEEMKRHWRMLGVFPDTFNCIAAAAAWEVGEVDQKVVDEGQDILSRLLQLSVLEWDDTTKRYRLHDLMRAFARGKTSEEERSSGALRHATHYLDVLICANELYLQGGESIMGGLALFDLEWENIRAGQSWTAVHANEKRDAARLCNDYPYVGAGVLDLRQHPREAINWGQSALAAARALNDRAAEGRGLGLLCVAYLSLGEYRPAIEYGEWNLAIAREIGARRGEGAALSNLGIIYDSLGDCRSAIDYHEQSLVIMSELGDRRAEGQVLGNLGNAYASLGEYHRAAEYHKQRLAVARELGDRLGEGKALGNLGNDYGNLGEYRRTIEYFEQQLRITREIGDREGEGNGLWNMGMTLYLLGKRGQAIAHAEAALRIYEQIEHPNTAQARAALEDWRREE